MKINKKGIAISLAALLALSPMTVLGDDTSVSQPAEIVPISAPIEDIKEEFKAEADFIKFVGKITEIYNDDNFSLLAENDLEVGLDALRAYIGEDTIVLNDKDMGFVDKNDLKVGMDITIYYHKDTIMALSYPPMLGPDVVVVNEKEGYVGIEVSKFDKGMLNYEGSLVIRPEDSTIIVDKDGNKVEKDKLANRQLIVFYDIVLESYPAQTYPLKVIVMPEREEEVVIREIILKHEMFKNEAGVTMIPLRLVGEALGYEVKWNQETFSAELTKGPQWNLVTIGEDNYNFAKMLIKLGTAPVLKDSRTYVPLSFAEQVLKANVEVLEDGALRISE